MKRRLIWLAAAVMGISGIGGAQGIAHAAPPTPVTCGSVITAPGEYYLASDCTGPGITIASSDVHLMLDGHTMDGTSLHGIGIFAQGVQNIRIEGPGTVTHYSSDGVRLMSVSNSHVWKVTATNISADGGFSEFSSSNNRWNNDVATDDSHGFLSFDSRNSTFVNNIADDVRNDGMVLSKVTGDHVVNNEASGNARGMLLERASDSDFDGNTTNNNHFEGIWLLGGSTGNKLHGNTAYGNGALDLEDDNPNCDSNNWEGNHFLTTNQPQCVS